MKIYKDDHKYLLTRCSLVTQPIKDVINIQNMFETMYEANGSGLAANQVGILKQVFIMDSKGNGSRPFIFINPRILEKSDKMIKFREGCLSYLNHYIEKIRHNWIKIAYTDLNGVRQVKKFIGFEAVIIQHEMDHLDGKSFIGGSNGD